MLAQLDRLQTVIGLPEVRFGIIPFNTPVVEVPASFSIFDDLVLVKDQGSATFEDGADTLDVYNAMSERLWSMAAEGDETGH